MSARPARSGAVAAAAALALLAAAPSVRAHDFWLEPSSFVVGPSRAIAIRLCVGENLIGDPLPRPADILRFGVTGPDGASNVSGQVGSDPAGAARFSSPGVHWVGYEGRARRVELDAAKFHRYLGEEGLEAVIDWRERNGEAARPGRELFSRCAKARVVVEPAPASEQARLGCPLELFVETHGRALEARLEFRDRPLAGALVAVLRRDGSLTRTAGRTDADGRVTLDGGGPGVHLVKAVHMVRLEDDSRTEWRSFWASLTLDVK